MSHNHWSYWELQSLLQQPQVVVIGSGIVGASAAYHLKKAKPSWDIVIVDRGMMPLGASTRNAGFACFGSVSELLDDMQQNEASAVWATVQKRWEGLAALKAWIGEEAIGYESTGGYEIFQAQDAALFEQCTNSLESFNAVLQELTGLEEMYSVQDKKIKGFDLGNTQHLIHNKGEGLIHTGKMIAVIQKKLQDIGVRSFYGAQVIGWDVGTDGIQLHFSGGYSWMVPQIVVATNGFTAALMPELQVQPARNQVLVTKPLKHLSLLGGYHYDAGYIYFRHLPEGRILLGGARNVDALTEETEVFGTTHEIKTALLSFLHTVVSPHQAVEVDYWWSGIMGVGQQKAPIVRSMGGGVYTAVRMGGMGVAIGTKVGQEVAQLLIENS